MTFTYLIAAFGAIVLVLVLVTIVGAIGRRAARRENREQDAVIVDSRDGFDPK